MRLLKEYFPLIGACVAAVALIFMAGLFLGITDRKPAPAFRVVIQELKDLTYNWQAYFADTPTQHLRRRTLEGDGVVVSVPDKMQPGPTFMSGLFGDVLGFRLVAEDGELLHQWPINFFEIAPELMDHQFHALIHGTVIFPNGDIVANLDGRGMVRFDKCGEIIWRNASTAHHSIDMDDAGTLWAPTGGIERTDPRFIALPSVFDRLVRTDAQTGEVLETLDLFDIMLASDLISIAPHVREELHDVTHLNDVEVLDADMADAFPMFNAGDMVMSMRNIHTIWVVDGETHKIKWWFAGPLRGQHDPDFQPDGTITVFDNRGREASAETITDPDRAVGSRILRIDPKTNAYEAVFQSSDDLLFATTFRGKHEMLANGNILVAETDRGRAMEVTAAGELVWSYVNSYDAERVGWIMRADRLDPSYAEIDWGSCS